MRAKKFVLRQAASAREAIKDPRIAISLIIIVLALAAGYARYQYVQAELAAQQNILDKIHDEFDDWSDDLSKRVGDLTRGIRGTARDAGNVVGGVWGLINFVVKAILDYIGNLHIMIPVSIIYFCAGFFGPLKMRAATLVGVLIALWVATSAGIVQGSVIGLSAIAALLFWNKIDSRLLPALRDLPATLKAQIQRIQTRFNGSSAAESKPTEAAEPPV